MKKMVLIAMAVLATSSVHMAESNKRKITIQNAGPGYVDLHVYYTDQRVCRNGPIRLESTGNKKSTQIYVDGECPLNFISYKRTEMIHGGSMETEKGMIERKDLQGKSKIELKRK